MEERTIPHRSQQHRDRVCIVICIALRCSRPPAAEQDFVAIEGLEPDRRGGCRIGPRRR